MKESRSVKATNAKLAEKTTTEIAKVLLNNAYKKHFGVENIDTVKEDGTHDTQEDGTNVVMPAVATQAAAQTYEGCVTKCLNKETETEAETETETEKRANTTMTFLFRSKEKQTKTNEQNNRSDEPIYYYSRDDRYIWLQSKYILEAGCPTPTKAWKEPVIFADACDRYILEAGCPIPTKAWKEPVAFADACDRYVGLQSKYILEAGTRNQLNVTNQFISMIRMTNTLIASLLIS